MCGVKGYIEVHHIRALKDLNVKGQRKKKPWEFKTGEPCAVKVACTVRRGVVGEVPI